MNDDKRKRMIEVLKIIADDQKADAKNFEGQPFNGGTVGTYFGYQGAAIASLADIVREVLRQEASDE